MERLRIKFRSEGLDPLLLDPQATGAKGLSHGKVFKVPLAHSFDPPQPDESRISVLQVAESRCSRLHVELVRLKTMIRPIYGREKPCLARP
jgi:hypothetical protein